jgi:hypothetical protein
MERGGKLLPGEASERRSPRKTAGTAEGAMCNKICCCHCSRRVALASNISCW